MYVDLKDLVHTPEVLDLLSCCLIDDEADVLRSVADYYKHKEGLALTGYRVEGLLLGVIGYAFKAPKKVIITHLAVNPAHRNKGIATKLIGAIVAHHNLKWVGAEATPSAVSFYQRLAFKCQPRVDHETGTTRFTCQLSVVQHPLQQEDKVPL